MSWQIATWRRAPLPGCLFSQRLNACALSRETAAMSVSPAEEFAAAEILAGVVIGCLEDLVVLQHAAVPFLAFARPLWTASPPWSQCCDRKPTLPRMTAVWQQAAGARVLAPETFEVSIDTSQHAFLCPLKAFSGLDRPRENLKGLKQVLLATGGRSTCFRYCLRSA